MKFIYCNLFISILFMSCGNSSEKKDPIPTHDQFTIESKQVEEKRNINVWTPPEYKTSADPLPVMYMADGGIIDEDFPHIANTLAELIKLKSIPLLNLERPLMVSEELWKLKLQNYTNAFRFFVEV